jgi:hypothetical protein
MLTSAAKQRSLALIATLDLVAGVALFGGPQSYILAQPKALKRPAADREQARRGTR